MCHSHQPRIYLAGPDVFVPSASTIFAKLASQCRKLGLTPLAPLDSEESATNSLDIYKKNLEKLLNADAVLANLNPFRSATEPDCGTAFEVGYAVALGLPVAGWLFDANKSYEARISASSGTSRTDNGRVLSVADSLYVEDFDLPVNLMLAHGCALFSSPEEGLEYLAKKLAVMRSTR